MRTIEIKPISVSRLRASGLNPRHVEAIPGELLDDLAAQLRAGQREPLIVREGKQIGTYEIADGETRWQAAIRSQADERTAIQQLDCEVRELTDGEMVLLALAKGVDGARRNLSDVEAGEGYERLMKLENITQAEVARRLGIDPAKVHRCLQLLELPNEARHALIEGRITAQTGRLLSRVAPERRAAAVKAILHPPGSNDPLNYDDARIVVESNFCRSLADATWNLKEASDKPACVDCPHYEPSRRGRAAVCHRPECFDEKLAAERSVVEYVAEEAGKKVLSAKESERVLTTVSATGKAVATYDSGFARADEPPPDNLLKPEIRAAGKVETFAELADGPAAKVQIFTAFDAKGRPVDLVKVSEAVAAAELNGHAIFSRDVASRMATDDGAAGAEKPAPQRAAEKLTGGDSRARAEASDRKAREKAAEALEASAKWLLRLNRALAARFDDETVADLWLNFELSRAEEADLRFVAKAMGWDVECISDWAADLSARELIALALAIRLAPHLRASGADASWVVEWHRAVVEAAEKSEKRKPSKAEKALRKRVAKGRKAA